MDNIFDILDDDLDVLEIIYYGFPREINIRKNYFEDLSPLEFFKTFRLYKDTVLQINNLIGHNLQYPDNRNNSLSSLNQILCALRFYASSGHLRSVAHFMSIDVSTTSRIVKRVSLQLARLYPVYIKMPHEEILIAEQEKFFNLYGFPRVIGVVDGTHIKIQSPGGVDGEVFRNRKGFFSINVQVVGNADLKLIDVVARWPGSAHDATIFANSRLRTRLEEGEFPNSFLLGDSAYPLREYILTPLANPRNEGEELYQRKLVQTRNLVERNIGIWKRRFPVLAYGLRLKLDTSMTVIIATAVLHNIARQMNEPEPPPENEINMEQLNYLIETEVINVPAPNDDVPINFTQMQIIQYFQAQG